MIRWATLCFVFLFACGDDGSVSDAATDSSVPDADPTDSGSLVSPVAPPSLPDFSLCPEGWRQVEHPALAGLSVCEPWPEGGAQDCAAPHEAHFPGGAGCERVGSACPSDGWPAGLPSSGVTYVRADAAAGGDGSEAAPFVTIQEGVDAAADGEVVAIATGSYDGRVNITAPRQLWGACAEGVVLTRAGGTSGTAIVSVTSAGVVELRELQLRSDRNHLLQAQGSEVTVRAAVFDGTGVIQSGGRVVLDQVAMRGFGDSTFAVLNMHGGASTELSRASITSPSAGAVSITGTNSIRLTDVVVRDTRAIGIQLGGTEATLERVVVEGTVEGGILLDSDTSTLTDVVVRRIAHGDEIAVGLFSSGPVTMQRIWIEDAADIGLSTSYSGGEIRDVVVVGPDTVGGAKGRGIELAAGAQLVAERAAVLHTADLGILVDGAMTTATLSDLVVDEVGPAAEGNFGRCLHTQRSAQVSVSRARFGRCREAAVTASYDGSVTLRDVRIEDTLPVPCELGCESPRAGIGLVPLDGGHLDAERFVITDSALAGVQIVPGGEVDLRDGTIEMNPVGVNVQAEGYDISRVMQQVLFRDNGVNLDSTELPVPAAMTSPSMP